MNTLFLLKYCVLLIYPITTEIAFLYSARLQ